MDIGCVGYISIEYLSANIEHNAKGCQTLSCTYMGPTWAQKDMMHHV